MINKFKTIENLLNRIDLNINNIPRNIKVIKDLGRNINTLDYIKYLSMVLDYELDLLIRLLEREKNK